MAGAPKKNKNARKDGVYESILYENLTGADKAIADKTPLGSKAALEDELKILKVREYRLLNRLAGYEELNEEATKLNTVQTGHNDKGDYTVEFSDSIFARIIKTQDALNRVQGKIAAVVKSISSIEENERRFELENEKLELARLKATGEFEIDDEEEALYE